MNKKAKLFIMLALVILLVVVMGAILMLFNAKKAIAVTSSKATSKRVNKKDLILLNVKEPIVSNINEDNEIVWIKVKIALEVNKSDKGTKKFIEEFQDTKTGKQVIIRDTIIRVLKEQTHETIMEQEAQDKIGEQIQTSLNEILGEDIIQQVYFGEFIIQQ